MAFNLCKTFKKPLMVSGCMAIKFSSWDNVAFILYSNEENNLTKIRRWLVND